MTRAMIARARLRRKDFTLDIDVALPDGGVTGLFGPSGCGKTTFLRCLAGLEQPDEGEIRLGDRVWQAGDRFVPTHRRSIGFLFQDSRLFPHIDVRDNLLFGFRRTARDRRKIMPDDVIGVLGLQGLLDHRPHMLSGGQRQRVALGRALLTSPALLLLDEPLAALDLERKAEILPFLEQIYGRFDVPMIYVSHDLAELTRIADRLVIMDDGRILCNRPTVDALLTLDPVRFGGELAVTVGCVTLAADPGASQVTVSVDGTNEMTLPLVSERPAGRHRLRIAARDVTLSVRPTADTTALLNLQAVIEAIPEGDAPLTAVKIATPSGLALLSLVDHRSRHELGLHVGQKVFAHVTYAEVIESGSAAGLSCRS